MRRKGKAKADVGSGGGELSKKTAAATSAAARDSKEKHQERQRREQLMQLKNDMVTEMLNEGMEVLQQSGVR